MCPQFRAWRRQPQEPQEPQRGRKPTVEASVPTDGHRELMAIGAARGVAAVVAVLAVEGGAVATEAEGLSDPVAEADAIEERAAMAADSVPAIYLDAWARLQVQRPLSVTEDDWRSAVDDAGLFLDAWSEHAASMGWDACDLFDVPRQGRSGGLVWQLRGERVDALGEDHARTAAGRTIERRRKNSTDEAIWFDRNAKQSNHWAPTFQSALHFLPRPRTGILHIPWPRGDA